MRILKAILGIISFPFKVIYELLDPILRYFEMAVNIIINYVLGGFVDLLSLIPSPKYFSIGDFLLSLILSVCLFFFFDKIFVTLRGIHIAFKILICVAVLIVFYFVSYFVVKFVINALSSLFSVLVVLVRLSIYMPASPLFVAIKLLISLGCGSALFFPLMNFWIAHYTHIIWFVCAFLAISLIISIAFLLLRSDVKFNSLGKLADVTLEDLKPFNHSIGIYMMTMGAIPVYIGRAIEFNNGGFRKRLRDYLRDSNSGRKHTSGRLINANKDELKLFVIELGHTEEDVERVKNTESSLISNIFTKFNEVDSVVNYVINILGYLLAGAISALVISTISIAVLTYILYAYALITSVICIIMYIVDNH